MTEVFSYRPGTLPLLISIPHDGRALVPGMADRMTEAGRDLADTDWHVAELYALAAEQGAHLLVANYSRYVVDLNRPPDDTALYDGQVSTGLCPLQTFTGADIYQPGQEPDATERDERRDRYWRPYHDMLRAVLGSIRNEAGYALLWDAHSIRSSVPALFDGVLPDLNIGTDGGKSCDAAIEVAVTQLARGSGFSYIVNGRFRGGYITRYFGAPGDGTHAIQLEVAQRAYMDEDTLRPDQDSSARLAKTIRGMLGTYVAIAEAAGDYAPLG